MYADREGRHNEYSFREAIQDVRDEASQVLDKTVETRAYDDPKSLVSSLSNDDYKVVASIQHESGARINEVWQIEKGDLLGIREDSFTGRQVGVIEVEGKGGKEREIQVSVETYEKASCIIERNGSMEFDKNDYREAIKEAALESGQEYHGSHGLRWNFAEERMEELRESTSMMYEERLQEVSWEMGHERADIAEHYLS
jgi:integrase